MLQSIKNARNDLAYGVKSFADIGKNATPFDLERHRGQTFEILEATLNKINDYLENKRYLHSVPASWNRR
jgi:hypothetical protein